MDVFSNLMVAGECLLDGPRTRAFERAIAKVVKPGHSVLDVGTGSGVLAMFAARAGAGRVMAVDIAPDIIAFARENVAENGLADTIEVVECDGRRLPTCDAVDVVTMELMDTWLVAEQQDAAMNGLHASGTIVPTTVIVPYRYQCLIELVDYDFSFYGFHMPVVIQARNFAARKHVQRRLSAVHVAQDISFRASLSLAVERKIAISADDDGQCNAAVLTARTFLAPDISIGSTSDMNMPVIIPLPRRRVRRGEQVVLDVSYSMGAGFRAFDMDWAERRASHVAEPTGLVARLDTRHPAAERV